MGGNYLIRCPAHDDQSPSLSLCDGKRGLVVHCFSGCDPLDVLAAIREIDHGSLVPRQTSPQPHAGSPEYTRRQHDKAQWLWNRRCPLAGSLAETYLRYARCYTGPLPPTLAFLPPSKPEHHPAMIAAFALVDEPEPGVLAAPRHVRAVHLTFLKRDGSSKADVQPNRKIIGSPLGMPIVLAPPNDLLGLAITEGIEDGLTAYEATGLGVMVAGAAGFMPKIADAVPGYIEAVTLYLHPDTASQNNGRRLAAVLHERGIEVFMEAAP
jgi:putative DNA primase/helicase